MPVVVLANPKGGVGKSTLSTNTAGYFASQGHKVMLGDADRQQSSRLWLGLRPATARPIVVCLVSSPRPNTTTNEPPAELPRCSAKSSAASSIEATEALASPEPRP